MKKIVGFVSMLGLAMAAMGQGQVNFLNFNGTTVDGKVSYEGSFVNSAYYGQLFAGPDANSLAPVGVAVLFLDGAGAGIVSGGTVNIPTVTPAGGPAAVQLRAWAAASGADWAEASSNPAGIFGESNIVLLGSTGNQAGSPPSTPSDLVGLQPFSLTLVPEPSTWALLALGLGALALRRRK
jgi:hypothetical protein